jgi:hypothetical protein
VLTAHGIQVVQIIAVHRCVEARGIVGGRDLAIGDDRTEHLASDMAVQNE